MGSTSAQKTPKFQHVRFEDMPVEHLNPQLDRQYVAGARSMLVRLVLRAGCIVPLHSHENEQITYILEGVLKFSNQDQEIVVRAGEAMIIPPHMPHTVEALEDTTNLDIFSPPRADWLRGEDAYLRG